MIIVLVSSTRCVRLRLAGAENELGRGAAAFGFFSSRNTVCFFVDRMSEKKKEKRKRTRLQTFGVRGTHARHGKHEKSIGKKNRNRSETVPKYLL